MDEPNPPFIIDIQCLFSLNFTPGNQQLWLLQAASTSLDMYKQSKSWLAQDKT